jgi:hypothetical protein
VLFAAQSRSWRKMQRMLCLQLREAKQTVLELSGSWDLGVLT